MPLPQTLFWTELADDLVSAGRIEDAARYLAIAVSKTTDPSLMNRLGWTYLLRSMLDDADRCFRQAADLAPRDHVGLPELRQAGCPAPRRESCPGATEPARALSPRRYDVLYSLALVYRQLGRTARRGQSSSSPSNNCREHLGPQPPASNVPWPRYSL